MNKQEIRLECYRVAIAEEFKRPGLKRPPLEIAKGLAAFCEESALRLNAVKFAFAVLDSRAPIDKVMDKAQEFLDFAEDKKKPAEAPPSKPSTPQKRSQKKVARHSR